MTDKVALPDGLENEAPDPALTPELESALHQLAELLIDAYLESKRPTPAMK